MKRYLIYLLATAASVLFCAPNLMAQNNGNSESADDNITVVSAEGRSALVTNDGGKHGGGCAETKGKMPANKR